MERLAQEDGMSEKTEITVNSGRGWIFLAVIMVLLSFEAGEPSVQDALISYLMNTCPASDIGG